MLIIIVLYNNSKGCKSLFNCLEILSNIQYPALKTSTSCNNQQLIKDAMATIVVILLLKISRAKKVCFFLGSHLSCCEIFFLFSLREK